VNLFREAGQPLVIGHRGAAAWAPDNTLSSLEAAVAAGADLVEFDVSPDLRLAHSRDELPEEPLLLDEALEFVCAHDVGAHVDVKLPGYEQHIVDAIRRYELTDRALVATAWRSSSRRFRVLAPELPVAFGYPRDRLGLSDLRWPGLFTRGGAAALRLAMPARVPLLLRESRGTVLALHHTLCSSSAVAAAHRFGAPVLAWTVNDAASVERVTAAGVDGIVSDDPEMARRHLATLPPQ
jgi:glycerophosphoryl diester phosphodiesterase